MTVHLIAAVAEDGTIGLDGGIPWNIRADLRRFRELTMGHAVVMGRATFASLRKPLVGRTNLVVTREPRSLVDAGVAAFSTPDRALDFALRVDHEPFVIGGAAIYNALLARVDVMHLTEVGLSFPEPAAVRCSFPTGSSWEEVFRSEQMEENGVRFQYVTRKRRGEPPR